jgi:hypothetical protein
MHTRQRKATSFGVTLRMQLKLDKVKVKAKTATRMKAAVGAAAIAALTANASSSSSVGLQPETESLVRTRSQQNNQDHADAEKLQKHLAIGGDASQKARVLFSSLEEELLQEAEDLSTRFDLVEELSVGTHFYRHVCRCFWESPRMFRFLVDELNEYAWISKDYAHPHRAHPRAEKEEGGLLEELLSDRLEYLVLLLELLKEVFACHFPERATFCEPAKRITLLAEFTCVQPPPSAQPVAAASHGLGPSWDGRGGEDMTLRPVCVV